MRCRACRPLFLFLSIAALAACGGEADRAGPQQSAGVTIGSFVGTFDAATGTMTFSQAPAGMDDGALVASSAGGFVPVEVVQDGMPFSGPPDSVELWTLSSGVVQGGCGARDAFEGYVQINSFYDANTLRETYVEITTLPVSGFESCKSAPPPDPGISDQLGLFPYGEIAPSGSSLALWNFAMPSAQSFTFTGRVVAQISYCGDGLMDPGEACDDGFADDCGTCNATCTGPGAGSFCGDGLICPETEECDDGGADPLDGCSAVCAVEPGDTCSDLFDLVGTGDQGDGTYVFRHDTRLLTRDYAAPCSATTNWQDAVAVFTAPTAGDWTFATTSTFDAVLWITDSCEPGSGTTLACVDAAGHAVTPETITVALAEGQTVYVFVDGYNSLVFANEGTFTLTVTWSPSP